MKAAYNPRPDKISRYSKSSSLYRWDIKQVESHNPDTEGMYECLEVPVCHPLTPNKITEAVIRDQWPIDYEQKLVNEYNAVQLGIVTDETEAAARVNAYKQFLKKRAEIKAQIDADCAELDINEL